MAAARRQQTYVPLTSTQYGIVEGEPIYLVDVDGTLLKRSEILNDGLFTFLRGKPNVFLFTKMNHASVMTAIEQINMGFGYTPSLIRYQLIRELTKRGVAIQGVITPGDVKRFKKKTGTYLVPGTNYVNYLGKLEYDNFINPSDQPVSSFLSPEEESKEKENDDTRDDPQELKNEMYKMAKIYFSTRFNHHGPIVFIDDGYEQLLSVGMQELMEPLEDSIPLILIKVTEGKEEPQEFFTDVMDRHPRGHPRGHPSEILYNDIVKMIREYFVSLSKTPAAIANKKGELRKFLNDITNNMTQIPREKSEFIERIRELLDTWPAEPRAPAPIAAPALPTTRAPPRPTTRAPAHPPTAATARNAPAASRNGLAAASQSNYTPLSLKYEPLSLKYKIDPDQPIYLVNGEGTLVKAGQTLNEGLVSFLIGKPNVFLFIKLSLEIINNLATMERGTLDMNLVVIYNLIGELNKRGVQILGVITPGDFELSKSYSGIKPGRYYASYLRQIEYVTHISPGTELSSLLLEQHEKELPKFDVVREFKNKMYQMVKTYFEASGGQKKFIFIDDEIEQTIAVALEELRMIPSNPQRISSLNVINVESGERQREDFFDNPFKNMNEILFRNAIIELINQGLSLKNQQGKSIRKEQFQKIVRDEFLDFLQNVTDEKDISYIEITFAPICKILGIDLTNPHGFEQRAVHKITPEEFRQDRLREIAAEAAGKIWRCLKCDFYNQPSAEVCVRCGFSRVSDQHTRAVVNRESAERAAEEKGYVYSNSRAKAEPTMSRLEASTLTEFNRSKVVGSRNHLASAKALEERNAPILKPGEWSCLRCTFTNQADATACSMCGALRSKAGGGKKYKSKNKTKTKKTLKSKKSIKKPKKNLKSKKTKKSNKSKKNRK